MAKIKTKGTVLQQSIANVFTPVAQIISLDGPDAKAETTDGDTLDNPGAGILKIPTYRTEPGNVTGEVFFDPALAGHRALTALLTTPGFQNWKMIFANASATEWPFTGAGFNLGPAVALKDGLKAKFGIELADLVTYPT